MQRRVWLHSSLLAVLLISASFLFSSYQAKRATEDIWKMLGITRQAGTEQIKNSFVYGYLSFYGARNAKNVALNDRPALAKDLLTYTKQYIGGAEFKKQYEELRKSAKPQEPEVRAIRTIEQIQKEEIAKTEKSIKESEKTMKELGGDLAKAVQPVVDMQKKNLKDYQDPKNPYFASIRQGELYQQEDQARRYKEDMANWEKMYPVSVNVFIADKLKKMLEATKDIDYSAELVEKYGKKRFVNPAYESKRTEWKQGFRAGKAVTETARTFAQQWLEELK